MRRWGVVLTSPQLDWDTDTRAGGWAEPPPPPTRTEITKDWEGVGGGWGKQDQVWGGGELGPRWQNFRYIRCATLAAVLPSPALPPEHNKDGPRV